MNRDSDPGDWSPEDRGLLQNYLGRFTQAWRAVEQGGAGKVDLNQHLPPRGHPLRTSILHELILVDLEKHWARGVPYALEQYLVRFPELGDKRDLPPRLVHAEYVARQKHGDKPALNSYQSRFPVQFGSLQSMLSPPHKPAPAAINSAAGATPLPPTRIPGITNRPATSSFIAGAYEGMEIGGGYTLAKRLGSGAFGEVWRAEAPGGVEVAVKIIFRSFSQSDEAKRELEAVEAVKKLRHPFLLQTQAYWQLEDRLLIIMELADGSLRDRLEECKAAGKAAIPPEELITCFGEAAEALDHLHERNILHRDVKPENILLLSGHAKLADFGLAKVHEFTGKSVMASGSGTPIYMAPELWRGKVNEHTDQYALAITYAELRLDRRPFTSRDMAQIMMDHLQGRPDLGSMPQAEQDVIIKALSKEYKDRYPSCKAFVKALSDAHRRATRTVPTVRGAASAAVSPQLAETRRPALTEPARSIPPVPAPAPTPAWKAEEPAPASPWLTVAAICAGALLLGLAVALWLLT